MYKQKLKYKINQFLNYRAGFSLLESKGEEKFYNLCLSNGIRLKRQYRFTKHLSIYKRILIFLLPFLHNSFRCDFIYKKTIIEIDGAFHNKEYDRKRDILMQRYGFKIIRIEWSFLFKPKNSIEYKKLMKVIQYLKKL
jgi:hypothetical protein